MKTIILTVGQRFGQLVILHRAGSSERGKAMWLCRCDCGNTKKVAGSHLKEGHTRSCGCLWQKTLVSKNTTHSMSRTSIYSVWKAMKQRCYNRENPGYKLYGGRGIKVCKRWQKFENFYADMGEKPKDMTIDRRDNSKGYSPLNCRWASRREQENNKRGNCILMFEGRKQTIAEWSRELGVSYNTLWNRVNTYGWSIERALTEPINEA